MFDSSTFCWVLFGEGEGRKDMPENVFLIRFGPKFLLTSAWIGKQLQNVVFSNKSIQKGLSDFSTDLIELGFFIGVTFS